MRQRNKAASQVADSPRSVAHRKWKDVYEIYDTLRLNVDTDIRILRLEGCLSDRDAPLRGRLEVIDMKDPALEFQVLSHAWDEIADSIQIIMDGDDTIHELPIPNNCASALRHLRKAYGPMPIWVDTICINQANNERGKADKVLQLPLMGKIYSSAQTVYLWLGEGTEKTDKAMDYLAKGALPFSFLINRHIDGRVPTGRGMTIRFALHLLFRSVTFSWRPHFEGLDDIFSRKWITRLWTLQEAILPQNSVIVCGNKSIPWKSMMYALILIRFEATAFKESLTLFGLFQASFTTLIFPPSFQRWEQLMHFWLHRPQHEQNRSTIWELQIHKRFLAQSHTLIHTLAKFIVTLWPFYIILTLLTRQSEMLSMRNIVQILKNGRVIRPKDYMMILLVIYLRRTPSSVVGLKFVLACFGMGFALHLSRIAPVISNGVAVVVFLYQLFALISTFILRRVRNVASDLSLPYNGNESILLEICSRVATNPVDKYYGILGMTRGTDVQAVQKLDYSQSLDMVYRKLTTELLKYTNSLDILLLTNPSRFNTAHDTGEVFRIHDTPSWVVDWENNPGHWLNALYCVGSRGGRNIKKYPGATPGSPPIWNRQSVRDGASNKIKLVVSGLLVGHLSWCSSHFSSLEKSRLDTVLLDSFARAIRPFEKNKDEENSFLDFTEYSGGETNGNNSVVEKLRPLAAKEMILTHCSGKLNGYGAVPQNAQENDIVALICGVSLPMILRKVDGDLGERHKVVGPAFMPRMMNGDLWVKFAGSRLDNLIRNSTCLAKIVADMKYKNDRLINTLICRKPIRRSCDLCHSTRFLHPH